MDEVPPSCRGWDMCSAMPEARLSSGETRDAMERRLPLAGGKRCAAPKCAAGSYLRTLLTYMKLALSAEDICALFCAPPRQDDGIG